MKLNHIAIGVIACIFLVLLLTIAAPPTRKLFDSQSETGSTSTVALTDANANDEFSTTPEERSNPKIQQDILIRYTCFGNTIAWAIYGEDNFFTDPELKDYQRAAYEYKQCVWSAGVKEYMPFPPLKVTSS